MNKFQCVLATSELESFVMFLYAHLQWTTGDASNGRRGLHGIEALAGFNAGDRINSYTIDGSQTPNVINLTRTSNVGLPGTWIFKVGQGKYIHTYIHIHIHVIVITRAGGVHIRQATSVHMVPPSSGEQKAAQARKQLKPESSSSQKAGLG